MDMTDATWQWNGLQYVAVYMFDYNNYTLIYEIQLGILPEYCGRVSMGGTEKGPSQWQTRDQLKR